MNKNSLNDASSMSLVPIDEVLETGTIFKDLFHSYKITPTKPVPQTESEKLMFAIQTYAIAAIDLNLYLDVHPNDANAVELFNAINKKLNEKIEEYEKKYGDISLQSQNKMTVPWSWLETNWPWEGNE